MKVLYYLTIFALLLLRIDLSYAQVVFGDQQIVSETASGAKAVLAVDLDGNSGDELIAIYGETGALVYFRNLGGGDFQNALSLASFTITDLFVVVAGSLSGNGVNDVVVGARNGIYISYNDGNGNFQTFQLETGIFDAESVQLVDLDGDNDLDILVSAYENAENRSSVLWYANNGSGSFGDRQVVYSSDPRPKAIFAGDTDNDGDQDLLVNVSQTGDVLLFANNGNGSFEAPITLSSTTSSVTDFSVIDVDGDARNDIVLSAGGSEDRIMMFKNSGGGTFNAPINLASFIDGVNSLRAADIEDDGDVDLFFASSQNNAVYWLENVGDGAFSELKVLTREVDTPLGLTIADLNEDGDLDVASASRLDNKIAWYGNGDVVLELAVSTTSINVGPEEGQTAIDVTNEGSGPLNWEVRVTKGLFISATPSGSDEQDLIIYYSDNLSGQERTGEVEIFIEGDDSSPIAITITQSPFEEVVLYDQERMIIDRDISVRGISAADLDGDGFLDVIATARTTSGNNEGDVVWYRNDGLGNFGEPNLLSVLNYAEVVSTGDIDRDGDIDVIATSTASGKIIWFENDGSGNFSEDILISTESENTISLELIDFDGDGDLDLLTGDDLYNGFDISWFRNNGFGEFSQQTIIASDIRPAIARAADFDGDGELDVVASSTFDDVIHIYFNEGNENFGEATLLFEASGLNPGFVLPYDFDEDGDMDLLVGADYFPRLFWFRNTGSGAFDAPITISSASGGISGVVVDDLDADGDLDVATTSSFRNTVNWYTNEGDLTFNSFSAFSDGSLQTPNAIIAADFDNDEDIDLLASASKNGKISWFPNITNSIPFSFPAPPYEIGQTINPNGSFAYQNHGKINEGILGWSFDEEASVNFSIIEGGVDPNYRALQMEVTDYESSEPDSLIALTNEPIQVLADGTYAATVHLKADTDQRIVHLFAAAKKNGELNINQRIEIELTTEWQEYGLNFVPSEDDAQNEMVIGFGVNVEENSGGSIHLDHLIVSKTSVTSTGTEVPVLFRLDQNYPNPFNPSTTIGFNLPQATKVTLNVFDITGKKVATMVNNKSHSAGSYTYRFNAQNLSSGVYFYQITTQDGINMIKKMTLIK
jgi:hypothetical protein